jgi:hypothetical protein
MNNPKRRIHVISTAALSVLVAALAIGVIAQQLAASRLSGGIQEQKLLLAKSRGELKDRAKWRDDYGDLALKLGGRMSTCSWSDQMPFMVAQVSGIVEGNGLKIDNLQPEPMTSSGSIQRFPMRLVLQTDLKHLTELLRDLRYAVPLIDVERLEVRNAQGESGKLQVNMTVSSFVVIDKNSPVARRRAVTPVKPAVARSANVQPPKPNPQPALKPPTAGPAAGPSERPNGSGRRMGPPSNGNGSKPAGAEPRDGGRKMRVPPGMDPSKPASPVPAPEGGTK